MHYAYTAAVPQPVIRYTAKLSLNQLIKEVGLVIMDTQLYFWKPLMKKHKEELLLVEKYYTRTKIQFDNIESEADEYANSWFNDFPATEDTDPGTVAEWATEKGIDFYETLSVMKSNHLLMTISMLYHIWEQQLIKFTIKELGVRIKFEPKCLDFKDVQKLFILHKVDITKTKAWIVIKELKLLTNTIKHGEGDSAHKLRKMRPDFFKLNLVHGSDSLELYDGAVLLNEYSLQVQENDLNKYILATQNFWDEMPERAYADINDVLNYLNGGK